LSRSATLLLALVALCAIAAGDNSSNASSAAKEFIDTQIIPLLRAYDESMSVSAATCPAELDFSGGKMPYCTITVNNVPVQVSIAYDASTKKIRIPPASFFEFDQVERLERATLFSEYGIKVDEVRCGSPRYRQLPVGTVFTCSVIGSPAVTELRLRAENNGLLFTFNPTGLTSPAWMLNAIAQHDAGKQTIIAGPTVAAWIQFLVTASAARNQKIAVQVHCASSVDVTGTNHAICIVSIQGHDVRREVFIDPVKGVESRTLDVPVDLATVQRETQDDLNRRLRQGGLQTDGVVRCNVGLLVVTPPSTFYCDAFGGGKPYKVEIKVQDTTGTVNWRFISGDTAPSPVPTASPGGASH
jgi:hypothetical protein